MLVVPSGHAEQWVSYNGYGAPGLVDLPTAEASPDAELYTTFSVFNKTLRSSIGFQITPRLSAQFRYTATDGDIVGGVWAGRDYFDRSFDVRYQLLTETDRRPGVAIGLQDFLGTGLYAAEYIVATKSITPTLRVTGGIGWGRLGSHNSFASFGTRPPYDPQSQGGTPNIDQWFRGPMAFFGGLAWSPTQNLALKFEYSSDEYSREDGILFDYKSPFNVGVDYRLKNGTLLSLYALHGDTIGLQATFVTNPKRAKIPGGDETAPLPIKVRSAGSAADLGWTADSVTSDKARNELAALLRKENLKLRALDLQPTSATARISNSRYNNIPEALGRTARAMSRALPASVETFVIVPVVDGLDTSAVVFKRSDLERLENAPAESMLARTEFRDSFGLAMGAGLDQVNRFRWSLSPYLRLSVFDPNNPVRFDVGAQLDATYAITPNLIASGSLTKKVFGNLADATLSPSNLPRVRTDAPLYSQLGDPAIEHLTLTHYGRPGTNLYSRVTAGLLEGMYGGVSGELLWKPVGSRFALGAELNYVKKRDYDQLFDFLDYEVATGHISGYYQFDNGFFTQLDVGRYLAGDIGATLTVERAFANGWRVGGYATLTDVSAEDFGEGSFDKGIYVTIPVNWIFGQPTRDANTIRLQSLMRDGGARLNVQDRLYPKLREYHETDISRGWAKFWR
ncbi:YjbH domain-containing protein [Shimia biformata]|uniref:YjbH domain-containing protein n=1 Tax=Shimia biformata TaxID=1294299 RepID=UPI00194F3F47|nr:YjbH domain-containing protein [Shimia biformata]